MTETKQLQTLIKCRDDLKAIPEVDLNPVIKAMFIGAMDGIIDGSIKSGHPHLAHEVSKLDLPKNQARIIEHLSRAGFFCPDTFCSVKENSHKKRIR